MLLLLVLIIAAAIGAVIGRQLKKKDTEIKGLGVAQSITVFMLIFFMGTKIGSDDRILESIQSIGVSSVVVTIATVCGSVLAVFCLRKLLKLNSRGEKGND